MDLITECELIDDANAVLYEAAAECGRVECEVEAAGSEEVKAVEAAAKATEATAQATTEAANATEAMTCKDTIETDDSTATATAAATTAANDSNPSASSASPTAPASSLSSPTTQTALVVDEPVFSMNVADYQLGPVIGFGSSAIVHMATFLPLAPLQVAIKMIELDHFDRHRIDELRKEIQVMALCKHANLLGIHTSFVHESKLWIVTPFLAGGSCLDLMKTGFRSGFEEEVIATILVQALQGLQYLHEHGHIHRDVKSGNLLMAEDGRVQLADFGVSASLAEEGGERRGVRKTYVGTPCWMAPEVMEFTRGYDFKADIWSFGITALELAYGHAPYAKFPPMKVIYLTLSGSPPTLDRKQCARKYSRHFKDMIDCCLQRDPGKRPTARALLKHPFFRQAARKPSFLVEAVLRHVPPVNLRDKSAQLKARGYAPVGGLPCDRPGSPDDRLLASVDSANDSGANDSSLDDEDTVWDFSLDSAPDCAIPEEEDEVGDRLSNVDAKADVDVDADATANVNVNADYANADSANANYGNVVNANADSTNANYGNVDYANYANADYASVVSANAGYTNLTPAAATATEADGISTPTATPVTAPSASVHLAISPSPTTTTTKPSRFIVDETDDNNRGQSDGFLGTDNALVPAAVGTETEQQDEPLPSATASSVNNNNRSTSPTSSPAVESQAQAQSSSHHPTEVKKGRFSVLEAVNSADEDPLLVPVATAVTAASGPDTDPPTNTADEEEKSSHPASRFEVVGGSSGNSNSGAGDLTTTAMTMTATDEQVDVFKGFAGVSRPPSTNSLANYLSVTSNPQSSQQQQQQQVFYHAQPSLLPPPPQQQQQQQQHYYQPALALSQQMQLQQQQQQHMTQPYPQPHPHTLPHPPPQSASPNTSHHQQLDSLLQMNEYIRMQLLELKHQQDLQAAAATAAARAQQPDLMAMRTHATIRTPPQPAPVTAGIPASYSHPNLYMAAASVPGAATTLQPQPLQPPTSPYGLSSVPGIASPPTTTAAYHVPTHAHALPANPIAIYHQPGAVAAAGSSSFHHHHQQQQHHPIQPPYSIDPSSSMAASTTPIASLADSSGSLALASIMRELESIRRENEALKAAIIHKQL